MAAATRVGGWLGRGWFRVDGARRRVAIDNLLASGVAADEHEARRIARASARHFATVLVESAKSHQYLSESSWAERFDLDIHPTVLEVLEDPTRGLLVASAHLGNWELGAHALSMWKPVVGAARRVNNPYLHRLMERRKPRFRFRLTAEYGGDPKRFLATISRGEALALLVDLDARGQGIKVDFFGRPAATHTTVPMLHLVTKAPLCLGLCLRLGGGRFRIVTSPVIEVRASGDKERDMRAVLARIHDQLEGWIRSYPEQYLWAHSRWKHGRWQRGMRGFRRGEELDHS